MTAISCVAEDMSDYGFLTYKDLDLGGSNLTALCKSEAHHTMVVIIFVPNFIKNLKS